MTTSMTAERPLRATLYELGLQSEDPDRLAAFYRDALGYRWQSGADGVLGVARGRRLSIAPGESKRLAYAAFAVPDEDELRALERRVAAAGIDVGRGASDGFTGETIEFGDLDGNRFRFGVAATPPANLGEVVADRPARLQHIVLASTDADRLVAFFIDVMGFTLSDRVVDDAGGLRTAFVRCSEDHHSLAVFTADENRLDHHCYEAGDWNLIRDWGDHFARQRVPVKWGPGRHGPGDNLFVFIHDPDGNWVEISAELEQVAHDRPVGVWPHEEYTLNTWGAAFLRS